MANTKSKITITIDTVMDEKLEKIMSKTLAGKSALVNDIIKRHFISEKKEGIKEGNIE